MIHHSIYIPHNFAIMSSELRPVFRQWLVDQDEAERSEGKADRSVKNQDEFFAGALTIQERMDMIDEHTKQLEGCILAWKRVRRELEKSADVVYGKKDVVSLIRCQCEGNANVKGEPGREYLRRVTYYLSWLPTGWNSF